MKITYDATQNAKNIEERNLNFERVLDFDWSCAVIEPDARKDYREKRFTAYGLIDGRLHCLVFTPKTDSIRVISLRKANKKEVKRYVLKN
jgi:uncharacterized DUF497 family protein